MSDIDRTNCTVLDLPIEEQRELARAEGLTLEQWVEQTKQELEEMEAFSAKLDANKDKRPDGWTEKDVERFQKKIDSATH